MAGGVSINDTLMHVVQDQLPFGGVGPSGMGHYHGYEGFVTFSKMKPVFLPVPFFRRCTDPATAWQAGEIGC